jgi:hypothetical protein
MKRSEILSIVNEEITLLFEAKPKKGDIIYDKDFDEYGVINKVKGKVAYVKFPSTGKTSFDPVMISGIKLDSQKKVKGRPVYISEGNSCASQEHRTSEEMEFIQNTKEGKAEDATVEKAIVAMVDSMIKAGKKPGEITKHLKSQVPYKITTNAIRKLINRKEIKPGEWLNESMIGIKTKANFKPNSLKGALERAGIKGFRMDRLSWSLTALKLDKKYFNDAKKIIDDLGLSIMMAKESVNEYGGSEFSKITSLQNFLTIDLDKFEKGLKDSKHKAIYKKARKQFMKTVSDVAWEHHKLYEGKLNEMDINDPVLVAIRVLKHQMKKKESIKKIKKISFRQYHKLIDVQDDIQEQLKYIAQDIEELFRDMEQEAEPEGGPIADKYGSQLDKLEKKYANLKKKKEVVDKKIEHYKTH